MFLLCFFVQRAFNFHTTDSTQRQSSDYVLLKLTLRFGVIVVEVLSPLCGGELTHILDKQIFFVVTAEPIWKEEAREEFVNNTAGECDQCT